MEYKKSIINFSAVSVELTGHKNQINRKYKKGKYIEFVKKCKEFEKTFLQSVEVFKKHFPKSVEKF